MKNLKYIFIILAVIAVVFFVAKNLKSTVPNTPEQVVRDLCYIWNTEAGDSATLRMDITNGKEVTGYFKFLPKEKDRKTGSIVGIAGEVDKYKMARTASLWWTASAEGVTNIEELSVIFGEGIANPGFGEMKDRGDGIYVYAYPDKLSYDLTLQQTNCNDEAVQ